MLLIWEASDTVMLIWTLENINPLHFNIVNTPYFSRAVVTVIRI